MTLRFLDSSARDAIVSLFQRSFSASEGDEEGANIARLVAELSNLIDDSEVLCIAAEEQDALAACIFFTRLTFATPEKVYLMAPVAVDPTLQRQGIGRALILDGLQALRDRGVQVAVTYGDPDYYGRMGFEPLAESTLQAPVAMSMPHGWLGQSLSDAPIPVLPDQPRCVEPFTDPIYW